METFVEHQIASICTCNIGEYFSWNALGVLQYEAVPAHSQQDLDSQQSVQGDDRILNMDWTL